MKISPDAALPIMLGTIPVPVVIALASYLVFSSQGTAPGRASTSPTGTATTGPGGSTTITSTDSQGGAGTSGSSGGLCITLLGCL